MRIPRELRAFAEVPQRTLLPAPGIEVRDDGRYVLVRGPAFANVSTVDVEPGELRDVVDEVRALAPEGAATDWWLGPSARPPDVRERLLALGLRAHDPSRLDALIALEPPAPGPAEVDVRRVETIDDFVVVHELRWEAFEISPERRARQKANLEAVWASNQANCHVFLAFVDGRPAGTGVSILGELGSFLIGGCTARWARGRGAYRALVRARWDDAVERGRPALVVHAHQATSAPILRRLGLVDVCKLERLEDPR